MRRFEFVQGTSNKFWQADVVGTAFVVEYGRIGAPPQRKEKLFVSADLATAEHDRKVAEKLREGYVEVTAAPAAAAPAAAPAAAAIPALAPRVKARKPNQAALTRAHTALVDLEAEAGGRSWQVSRAVLRAQSALRGVEGLDPATHAPIAAAWDALCDLVAAPSGRRRLPLRHWARLAAELAPAALPRALARWSKVAPDAPAAPTLAALAAATASLPDPELALRVALLLAQRPGDGDGTPAGWDRQWQSLRPTLVATLAQSGTSLSAWVSSLPPHGADAALGRRVAALVA